MVDLTFLHSGQGERMGHVTPFFQFIKPGMDLRRAAIYYLPNFPENCVKMRGRSKFDCVDLPLPNRGTKLLF